MCGPLSWFLSRFFMVPGFGYRIIWPTGQSHKPQRWLQMKDEENSISFMKKYLASRAEKVEIWLSKCLQTRRIPQRLSDSMLYSLLAGGKRIRPVLCLACASLCGKNEDDILPFAGAIEMIHTYSLIHDDLPAMDDDDLRRGKPSNHKAFDEATAILAGDALLTDAFGLACTTNTELQFLISAIQELSNAAGSSGMVGGQELDMLFTGKKNIYMDDIKLMQSMKTGALIKAACVCGALLAGASSTTIEAFSSYGQALGAAFQIADDILDLTSDTETLGKPAGSDEKSDKNTFPSLIGIKKSLELAKAEANVAKASLSGFDAPEARFLITLADYVVTRSS